MRVVMVPGFSLRASMWDQVAHVLDGAWEPVPIDVPATGDFLATSHAIGDLGGAGAYAGYSMGGRLALQLALDRPDLVHALILVSATAGIADHAERRRRLLEDAALADWIDDNGRELFLDMWLDKPIFTGLDPVIARRNRLESANDISGQIRRLGQGEQPSLWNRLNELEMPVLLVAGERDPKYVAIATELMTDVGINADLDVIPGATHALPLEWPAAVGMCINDFLGRHAATP